MHAPAVVSRSADGHGSRSRDRVPRLAAWHLRVLPITTVAMETD
jgi:hypothetical protein